MFKNMLKRSWLSIIRKPGRAVLIGLIVFAMANLVLASVTIKGAVSESVTYAKSSLGGTVYLQTDIEGLREQMQSEGSFAPGERPQIERPSITLSMVESIADSNYVKDYTYSLNAQAKASDFAPIESETAGFGGGRMLGGADTQAQLESDITIFGINSYAFITEVQNETMKITSGDYFDESTDDQAIVSFDLATSNGLEVGDTITLQNIYDSEPSEVAIIGIYDLTQEQQGFGTPENTIYLNTATASQFLSSEGFSNGNYDVQNVRFELTNAEHSDAFLAEANSKFPNLESDNLSLSTDDSAYEQMVGPIESVGAFATTIFWVVVIASIAIITLIVTINVKDRRYEMGVLLSLGAPKFNVAGQILVELLVVGTFALMASIGTGTVVAQTMSDSLLDNQIAMSQQQSEDNFNRPTGITGRGGGFNALTAPANQATQTNVDAIDSIDVNASASNYGLLFLIGYSVIILALLLPTWNIVKYQPKTILTGKE